MQCEKSAIGPDALSGEKCQSIMGAWGPGFGNFPVQIRRNRAAPKIVGLYHEQASVQLEAQNGKYFTFSWSIGGLKKFHR
jgi:hypothetical protein